jgi:hypothetical protein
MKVEQLFLELQINASLSQGLQSSSRDSQTDTAATNIQQQRPFLLLLCLLVPVAFQVPGDAFFKLR